MPTLTAPGVYVEEIPSGVRPIEVAGTSTAAFIGEAERGPVGEAVKVFGFAEFQTLYGGYLSDGRYLAHSVYQFFNNGGGACYIGRVAPDSEAASVTVLDRGTAAQSSLTFRASSPGAWGNSLMVVVDSAAAADPGNQFNLSLYRENPQGGDPVALEAYADLSMDPDAPTYVVDVVNTLSVYLHVVEEGSTNFLNGYSESEEIVVTGADDLLGASERQFRISINNDGFRTVDLTDALTGADLTDPEAIRSALEGEIQALVPLRGSTDADAYSAATVTFTPTTAPSGVLRITAGGSASAASRVEVRSVSDLTLNAAGLLNLGPQNGGTEVHGSADTRPQNTPADDFYLPGDDTVAGAVSAVTLGDDGETPVQPGSFIEAFPLLDTVRDVSLLAVPGVGVEAVISAGMNYCASRPLSDCFYVADMDVLDDTYAEAIAFRDALNNPNSYGAVYFPWLLTLDPTGQSEEPIRVPPSGFVTGLYGRIDGRRGVWKAPAGTEAILAGTVGLVTELTDVQHGDLNNTPKSVCVIRRFPTTGIVAWGARTISSDPEYKYVPIRRTAIMLRVSIFNGIQWAVFEPNDEPLWASLRLNIGTFMNTLFRRGAFQGSTPSQAYFVKCDAETTTQADIDLGIVNVLVGFAPLKPAEFVIVRIQQLAGQAP